MESVVFDCFLNFLWLWYIIKLAITFNTHIIEVLALGYFIRVCFSQLAFILVLMVSERKRDVWFLYSSKESKRPGLLAVMQTQQGAPNKRNNIIKHKQYSI